jgi:hypothetical protein
LLIAKFKTLMRAVLWLLPTQSPSQLQTKVCFTINYGLALITVKLQNISQITVPGHQELCKQQLLHQLQIQAIQHTQMPQLPPQHQELFQILMLQVDQVPHKLRLQALLPHHHHHQHQSHPQFKPHHHQLLFHHHQPHHHQLLLH